MRGSLRRRDALSTRPGSGGRGSVGRLLPLIAITCFTAQGCHPGDDAPDASEAAILPAAEHNIVQHTLLQSSAIQNAYCAEPYCV